MTSPQDPIADAIRDLAAAPPSPGATIHHAGCTGRSSSVDERKAPLLEGKCGFDTYRYFARKALPGCAYAVNQSASLDRTLFAPTKTDPPSRTVSVIRRVIRSLSEFTSAIQSGGASVSGSRRALQAAISSRTGIRARPVSVSR
jgi:hypothetical protein